LAVAYEQIIVHTIDEIVHVVDLEVRGGSEQVSLIQNVVRKTWSDDSEARSQVHAATPKPTNGGSYQK